MTDEMKTRADARLDGALANADQRDPRPFYRNALRHLRENDEPGFQRALRYFEEELVPAVAGAADPLIAWAEYGLMIGRTLGSGNTVELDATGRALPLESVAGAEGLVLYIPAAAAAPVLVLRYPRKATAPQHAAYELLVEGRQTASAYG
jgi:hypothetical protein